MTQIDVSAVTHNVTSFNDEIDITDAHERAVAIAKHVYQDLEMFTEEPRGLFGQPVHSRFDFAATGVDMPLTLVVVREFSRDEDGIELTIATHNPVHDKPLMEILRDVAYTREYDGMADDGSYRVIRDNEYDVRVVDVISTPLRDVVVIHINLFPFEDNEVY